MTTTHNIKPSLRARVRNRIGEFVEDNKTDLAYYAGLTISTVGSVVILDRMAIKPLIRDRDRYAQIAGDCIDFLETKGLNDEAKAYIATLPVTLPN